MISGVVNLGRDNDARLFRLRTALGLGTGFQLVIVEAEPGPIRKEVIRRILTWSGHDSIAALVLVSLDAGVTVGAQLNVGSGAIVTGLESPSRVDVPARDWVAELNWARDALPELVHGPLILVVSQAMHQDLFERGSDLYTWRRHTAHVTVTSPELARPLSSPSDHYYLQERERLPGVIAAAGSVFSRVVPLANLASALLELGDEAGAARLFDETLLLAKSLSHDQVSSFVRVFCMLSLAECAVVRGDLAVARSRLHDVYTAVDTENREGEYALVRGKLFAVEGAWDAAVTEYERAVRIAKRQPSPQLHASALECLLQTSLATGDIMVSRRHSADLIEIAVPFSDTWGTGILVRVAGAVVGVYPDEIAALLDAAFAAAENSSRRHTKIEIEFIRVKRARLLQRVEDAHEALVRARQRIRADDPPELHASLYLCEAEVALAGGGADDDIAALLARACELYRPNMSRQAFAAGMQLGQFWRARNRADLAAAAYRLAADDARRDRDLALAGDAELGELCARVESGIDPPDACERLTAVAEHLRATGKGQSEGIARTALGQCLLRGGFRERAMVELECARDRFSGTTDLDGERAVVRLLNAAPKER